VPRITRRASVVWEGNVARGAGSISAGTGAFAELAYSLPTRIGDPDGRTSPEELLAAAHGACYAMSLASELASAGGHTIRVHVDCEILMDEVEDQGHQIVASTIAARASADGVDDAALADAAAKADESCPFSALLKRAGARVEIDATLGA
jgi:osmotically inducible protein OsmC